MSLSPDRRELVAVDDGYDYTKVVTRSRSARIPTAYSLELSPYAALMGSNPDDLERIYEIEGVQYAVGPKVAGMETRFEDFPYHPANLAVAMDGIRRVVEPGRPVQIIAGVPLNRYYSPTGEINEQVLEKKSLAWTRHVKSDGPALPRIMKITVIAEAVAAWFDFVVNDNFVPNDDLINDFMAVVDIGGRTTDIAVFQDGNVNMAMSGTKDSGVLDVQSCVSRLLEDKFKGTKFPRSMLNDAVKFGTLKLASGQVDLSAEVIKERRSLVSKIEIFMNGKLGSQMPLIQRVLFVGGGAHALQFELKDRFPNAVFAQDPQMANARGMLKYGVTFAGMEDDLPAVVNA